LSKNNFLNGAKRRRRFVVKGVIRRFCGKFSATRFSATGRYAFFRWHGVLAKMLRPGRDLRQGLFQLPAQQRFGLDSAKAEDCGAKRKVCDTIYIILYYFVFV
jgi:hypothetical protein